MSWFKEFCAGLICLVRGHAWGKTSRTTERDSQGRFYIARWRRCTRCPVFEFKGRP